MIRCLTMIVSSYVALAGLFASGCGEDTDKGDVATTGQAKVRPDEAAGGGSRRDGSPNYQPFRHEGAMARAVEKARQTQREFVRALTNPGPQQGAFAVKKAFDTPGGEYEHIWVNQVRWDGSAFQGVINNEPVETKAVKLGDRVTVRPDEVSDWMYVDGRSIVGGYTLRVMHYQSPPEEQRAFVERTRLEVPPIDF